MLSLACKNLKKVWMNLKKNIPGLNIWGSIVRDNLK